MTDRSSFNKKKRNFKYKESQDENGVPRLQLNDSTEDQSWKNGESNYSINLTSEKVEDEDSKEDNNTNDRVFERNDSVQSTSLH